MIASQLPNLPLGPRPAGCFRGCDELGADRQPGAGVVNRSRVPVFLWVPKVTAPMWCWSSFSPAA